MRALVYGVARPAGCIEPEPRDPHEQYLASQPFGLHDIPEPTLRHGWILTRPLLAGICGSDSKVMLGDLSEGDIDNPMAAFSSLPYVPGHEVVAEVLELAPGASGVEPGQRVVLNPWLSCLPRGVSPLCPACRSGDLSLCHSFASGDIGPGVHIGVTADAPGGFAELMAAHCSMLIPVPDSIPAELAVLADPFSVSLHAVTRHPPPDAGTVIVYGAGALGLTTVAALRALYPTTRVAVVARFAAQKAMALGLGAETVFEPEPADALVEQLAAWSGSTLRQAFAGLPMAHPGAVDVVYDTVAKPGTLEVGIRLLASRGTLVVTGVHTPGRYEWTPIYFKELRVVGSNAFGMETVEGVRQHALNHYLDLVTAGRVDLSGLLTHRFALSDWWPAMLALSDQATGGAIKVAFDPTLT